MKLISAAHIAIGIIITAVFQTAAEKPHAPTVAESLRTNAPAKAHGEQDCVAAVRAAIDEIKRGQTNQAAKALKGLAENGCADAELEYGVACWSGIGRSVDKAEAARWFGMAATNGNLIAMQRLGYAYREGEGVSRDLTKADFWTRKAASGGLAMAQRAMGQRCYDTGELEESRKWNELAAAQNDSEAQFNLALLLEDGLGGPRDLRRAANLYYTAAMAGHDRAPTNLGAMYVEGRGVTQDPLEGVKWYLIAFWGYDSKVAKANLEMVLPRLPASAREIAAERAKETLERIRGTK